MTNKHSRRLFLLVCLLQLSFAGAQESRRIARPRGEIAAPPQTQPVAEPCPHTYGGRWLGSNQVIYNFTDLPDRGFAWFAPQLNEQGRGRCGGEGVWADWSGNLGQGRARGTTEGPPGGPATVIRWFNGVIFQRIPELAIQANQVTVPPGEIIYFHGESTPPIEAPYFIDYGDGPQQPFQLPDAAHRYGAPGAFEVRLVVVIYDRTFTSDPITITVDAPPDPGPSAARLLLSVSQTEAAVGETVVLEASLEPEIPGAVYRFRLADQISDFVSSRSQTFRCDTEGLWTAGVTARLPNNQFLESALVQIRVQAVGPGPTDPGNQTGTATETPDETPSPWWVVPGLVGLVGAVGVYRKLRKNKLQREQARMNDRVKYDPHSDAGTQCISPDPSRIRTIELAFRLTRNRGVQFTEGLSVTGERRRL